MPLCYLYFSFIFDKTYAQKNMKTKLIEKAKQISTEYKFGDFFRNFLAVILGIIITFAGSDWITEHNTQEEIKKSLQLVNSELLLNRDEIKAMGERVELEQHAANYLFENKNMPTASFRILFTNTSLPSSNGVNSHLPAMLWKCSRHPASSKKSKIKNSPCK